MTTVPVDFLAETGLRTIADPCTGAAANVGLNDFVDDLFNLDRRAVPVHDMAGSNTTSQCTDNGCSGTCTSVGCTKGCR